MEIDKAISAVLSQLRHISASETVVGEPIRAGEATVIPVSRLRLGFGVGVGDARRAQSSNNGSMGTGIAGGGVSVDPEAFIVVDPEGRASLLSLKQGSGGTSLVQAIELIPEVIEKVVQTSRRVLGTSEADVDLEDADDTDGLGGTSA